VSSIDLREARRRHPASIEARRRHPVGATRTDPIRTDPIRTDLRPAPRQRPRPDTARSPGRFRRRKKVNLEVAVNGPARPVVYWAILGCVVALCLIGLLFVLSASAVLATHKLDSSWHWFIRQVFFVSLGAVGMFVASRIDYRWWIRRGPVALVVSVFLLFLVLLPTSLRHEVNGSKRWLGPEFLSVQPSEIAKLAMILWLAGLLSRRVRQIRDPRQAIMPALAVLGLLAVLIMAEPDLGTTILISLVTFIMLSVAGVRLDQLAIYALPAVALGGVMSMWGYRRARMLAFLDPWAHATREGWQTLQSQVGIASGGWFGVGLGNGRSKWGFLPEAHTDFIFSVIGEELGLLGCLVVIGLFLGLVVAGINAGRRATELSGMLLALGISVWIGLQAMINISVTVGLLPNKGITLPFVSYGGSSLVMTMVAAGILLNIARQPGTRRPRRPASRS